MCCKVVARAPGGKLGKEFGHWLIIFGHWLTVCASGQRGRWLLQGCLSTPGKEHEAVCKLCKVSAWCPGWLCLPWRQILDEWGPAHRFPKSMAAPEQVSNVKSRVKKWFQRKKGQIVVAFCWAELHDSWCTCITASSEINLKWAAEHLLWMSELVFTEETIRFCCVAVLETLFKALQWKAAPGEPHLAPTCHAVPHASRCRTPAENNALRVPTAQTHEGEIRDEQGLPGSLEHVKSLISLHTAQTNLLLPSCGSGQSSRGYLWQGATSSAFFRATWSLQDSVFAFWDVFGCFGIFFSVSETSLNLPKLGNPWTCTQIYQCWYINDVRCSPAYLSSLCSAAQSSEAWSAVVWWKRIFKWWDWIFDNGGIMWMRRQESKRLILDASDTL